MRSVKVTYLDCCSDPSLRAVKVFLDTNRESESLCSCETCGAYWFHRFLEIMYFDRDDDQTTWYSRVSSEEAGRILGSDDRPDLTFLRNRPGFIEDHKGVRRTPGQPDTPCYG
jgi:hypothetical protein